MRSMFFVFDFFTWICSVDRIENERQPEKISLTTEKIGCGFLLHTPEQYVFNLYTNLHALIKTRRITNACMTLTFSYS
jgi:hypothetical protein